METDLDLTELIQQNDHLNILRYIRIHQLREPKLVVHHGKCILGYELNGKGKGYFWNSSSELIRLAILEQVCLAALDCNNPQLADTCLQHILSSSSTNDNAVTTESNRFQLLLGRCMEASEDRNADKIYDNLLKDNPSNLLALKRKYCILKSQLPKTIVECIDALNNYIQQNYADTSAWYELAKLRTSYLGDYKNAAYCYEEVLLGSSPSDAMIHCELAECYATSSGSLDDLYMARKHIAQALELDPTLLRAQMGLVVISNAYLLKAQEKMSSSNKHNKNDNATADIEFEMDVAKELVKYGVEQVLKSYQGTSMLSTIKILMNEYTADL